MPKVNAFKTPSWPLIFNGLEVFVYVKCHPMNALPQENQSNLLHLINRGSEALPTVFLSPDQGISPEKLPLDLGFFEVVHNAQKRGKAMLSALLECLLT